MKRPAKSTARQTEPGFTLVELVVTIAILAIALLGVANSLQFSTQHAADPLWQTKTVALVQAYADEIMTHRFDELTPIGGVPACTSCSVTLGLEAGETRGAGVNTYDDVDDYHDLDEQPPLDAMGNQRSEYAGYRVEVDVIYVGLALGLDADSFAKEITLMVTPPGQKPLKFSTYRGNF